MTDLVNIVGFEQPKPIHVFSHGMGTDTCTMIKMAYDNEEYRAKIFPKGYRHIVIFSDLGVEYPETYAQIDEQRRMSEEMGYEFVRLTVEQGYHPNYIKSETSAKSIYDWWDHAKAIGMLGGDKRCTDRWKIQPIWNYISMMCEREMGTELNRKHNMKKALSVYANEYGKFLLTIGFAKGEESRVNKTVKLYAEAGGWKGHVVPTFPLIDLEMSRESCNQYWENQELVPPRPSNCMYCFYQSSYELVNLSKNYPEVWEKWEKLENQKLEVHADKEKNAGVLGTFKLEHYLKKALNSVDKFTGKLISELTDEELDHRVQYHGGCVKNGM